MYEIIIVGAGPAGLTAAIYALRGNKKVLVLESKTYGGQIVNAASIENYPGIKKISGFDYAKTLYDQVIDLGGKINYEKVVKIEEDKTVKTETNTYNAKSVIIATGTENKRLELEKEQYFIGKGISYCATCDGNFFKNKKVAVVGGGNTAIEDALYLSDIAEKVYLIHRRDEFRGEEKTLSKLKEKNNVEFILNSNVVKLNGDNLLESIDVDTNDTINKIDINGLFIAIGQTPNNEIFNNVVDLEDGYIKSVDGIHTKTEGIYVAGDTRVKSIRQLTTAISDGAISATTAIKEME